MNQLFGDIGTGYILSLALLGLSVCIGYVLLRYTQHKKAKKNKPVKYARDKSVEEELREEIAKLRGDSDS